MTRPLTFENYVGQYEIKDNLKVFIQSALNRKEILDHVLLFGPPGVGKTTLATIVANELKVPFVPIIAASITDGHDLIKMLSNIEPNSVVFIDEIHRLNPKLEEILYSALEDFKFYITVGEQQVTIDLPKFTLIGATTKMGMISNPLRDRFGIQMHLRFYNTQELIDIVTQAAGHLNKTINAETAKEIAVRSRGTPRIALNLLKRVYDYVIVSMHESIDLQITKEALKSLDIDNMGLTTLDHRYLSFIKNNYSNKPVGLQTVSSALYEEQDVIAETVEPYLIKIGFLQKTPKGRMLTQSAIKHLQCVN